ncbi:MAG TPA: efflux RND transporter periplasmic adaptor subunit [Bryobacteraceae bacterium]|nr:efflux RND transporter periplasmic adaptor subunit [Bryobacteraceae bacterium]
MREAAVNARWFLALAGLIAAGGLAWGLARWRAQPPQVRFVRVTRQDVHSSVATNGKVEPIEWAVARAERPGPVEKILIHLGQQVAKGQPLVELDSTEARANLLAAQARIAQAQADLSIIDHGGRATDLAEIQNGLAKARFDLDQARQNYETEQRLAAKNAATAQEVNAAKARLEEANLQIQSLERKRAALASTADRAATEARLNEAQAAARVAEAQIHQSIIPAPVAGVVYQFDLKPGAYLNAGDAVASIGRMDQVRVNVYVDEPDLGRVKKGMPVLITWDALPGHQWEGDVDRTPTEVQALGTRQVGEVVCVIRNPDRDLLPGTNVNVEIRAQTVENALSVPKEAIRTEHGQSGVYLLVGDHVEWKKVSLGLANTTRTQIDGLKEGDAVALYTDRDLHDGMVVKPVFLE